MDAIRSLALAQKTDTARHRCPECSPRRNNQHDRPLSVTVFPDRATYFCHHCQASGALSLRDKPRPMTFIPLNPFSQSQKVVPMIAPAIVLPQEQLGGQLDKSLFWLAKRGITSTMAEKFGLLEESKYMGDRQQMAVGFPYKSGADTYAVKWRSIEEKRFTQTGSANTLWLIDYVDKGEPLVICEGEADALALWMAGIKAVSIPNGAPATVVNGRVDPKEDRKFSYVYAAKEIIEAAPKIILAVDNDGPGQALEEEIARRVGKAKCWKVQWPNGCKDAGDVLRVHGATALAECIEKASPLPVKGLYSVDTFTDRVNSLYDQGLPSGESTGYPEVDDLYTVSPGQLTVVTGSPGSGKSAFIDNAMVNIAKAKGWRFAVCSFENQPEIHIAKLAAIYAGVPFFDGPTPRMTRPERDKAVAWVRDHFVFLHQSDGSLGTLGGIMDLARVAVMRYGIRGIVLDPINYVARDPNQSETDWVSDALTQMKVFAMGADVHFWLVAHPFKMQPKPDGSYPVPTGYSISGSAHYFNKADMGITIHRPDKTGNLSEFHTWKSRHSWTGKVGSCELRFDAATGSFLGPYSPQPKPIYSCL